MKIMRLRNVRTPQKKLKVTESCELENLQKHM